MSPLETSLYFGVMPMIGLAMVVAFIRLLRGPSLPDRVVAIDLITNLIIGMIGVYAVATEMEVLLHIVFVIALTTFLATVALASYIERGA